MRIIGDLESIERRARSLLQSKAKLGFAGITLIEVVDEENLWDGSFEEFCPLSCSLSLEQLIQRLPILIAAVASEIGFRYEGVGTEFWPRYEAAIGYQIGTNQRYLVSNAFAQLHKQFGIAKPSDSLFSQHFSIIAWPIANALLPLDLLGAVSRLLDRAPAIALPSKGRESDFSVLRAWASSAEGARLTDWLRQEAASGRVLSSLLSENKDGRLPSRCYERIHQAIDNHAEIYFAIRSARTRQPKGRTRVLESNGRFSVAIEGRGLNLFVSWPAISTTVFERAMQIARAKAWRPRLWNLGGYLHPQTALSEGPFRVTLAEPIEDANAYTELENTFGEEKDILDALQSRKVVWGEHFFLQPADDRKSAEQCQSVAFDHKGFLWVAIRGAGGQLTGLRWLGKVCSYDVFEANLANTNERNALIAAGYLGEHQLCLARHPRDAISGQALSVSPGSPLLVYLHGTDEGSVQSHPSGLHRLTAGESEEYVTIRVEGLSGSQNQVIDVTVYDRDSCFAAVIEKRLQIQVTSRFPITRLNCRAELEIGGELIAATAGEVGPLPIILSSTSAILSALVDDRAIKRLLGSDAGVLRLYLGGTTSVELSLVRPVAATNWDGSLPTVASDEVNVVLAKADAHAPHQFELSEVVVPPKRGAAAYGFRYPDGRFAHPIKVFSSQSFDLGDLSAFFGSGGATRRLFDNGAGLAELARTRVAWARSICDNLSSISAKASVIRQFEDPLVVGLCGREWFDGEYSYRGLGITNEYDALWGILRESGMLSLVESFHIIHQDQLKQTFARHLRNASPEWPDLSEHLREGSGDLALNETFAEVLTACHSKGLMTEVENDFDFGWPNEDWRRLTDVAKQRVARHKLVSLIAPKDGAKSLQRRSYVGLSLPEIAEDLSAWSKQWAAPRGQMTTEMAAQALQLWLTPAAIDEGDAPIKIMARDPFVARAIRYAAIRAAV